MADFRSHLPDSATRDDAEHLRALSAWYRDFAEKAENPAIWESRLATAKDLERQALQLETLASSLIEGERD